MSNSSHSRRTEVRRSAPGWSAEPLFSAIRPAFRSMLDVEHWTLNVSSRAALLFLLLALLLPAARAAEIARPPKPPTAKQIDASIQRGISYLLKSQNKNGS